MTIFHKKFQAAKQSAGSSKMQASSIQLRAFAFINHPFAVAHASIISYNYKSSEFLTPGTFPKQAPYNILMD
jgi:hypothetical protein